MFDGLQILLNTIKQHQTRCPNGEMFDRQTMFDDVWSPNISRFSRALEPGHMGNVWRPNTIKHCLVTKHADCEVGGQTVNTCLIKHRSNN